MYDGKHEAIIPQDLWDKVQSLFKRRDQVAKPNTRISAPPLLKGILSCGCCGTSMTPSYSIKKNGTRYRYYTCSSKLRGSSEQCIIKTVSAAEVEGLVISQVVKLLERPEVVAHTIAAASIYGEHDDMIVVKALQDVGRIWDELFPAEQVRIIQLLIKRAIIRPEGLSIEVYSEGFNGLIDEVA